MIKGIKNFLLLWDSTGIHFNFLWNPAGKIFKWNPKLEFNWKKSESIIEEQLSAKPSHFSGRPHEAATSLCYQFPASKVLSGPGT